MSVDPEIGRMLDMADHATRDALPDIPVPGADTVPLFDSSSSDWPLS